MATGLVAAVLLAAAPFIPTEEPAVTGALLCGFALGWAMLAVFSVWFTDQPQRWAVAPALFMGMFVCVHRQLQSRGGRWLLYPVIAVLALAAIGGGYRPWVQQPMPGPTRCLGN